MKIIVLKFGGTSVGSTERIKKVAKIIVSYVNKKYRVIVVSSAMSGVTNDLVKKSKKLSREFSKAEHDVLVSSGEQMSCALISGRLVDMGYKSRSWMGWQIPIITTSMHSNARILEIKTENIEKDCEDIVAARPTAVNLKWAVRKVKEKIFHCLVHVPLAAGQGQHGSIVGKSHVLQQGDFIQPLSATINIRFKSSVHLESWFCATTIFHLIHFRVYIRMMPS